LARPGIAVATPFCRALTSKNLFEPNLIDVCDGSGRLERAHELGVSKGVGSLYL
jgi:hypothetical protein